MIIRINLSIMRPDPSNSAVDCDYFLDIWTAVTFLISDHDQGSANDTYGTLEAVSGYLAAMQPAMDIPGRGNISLENVMQLDLE